ncbi:MAG: hypothetical protein KAU31_16215, partial [Spirochaetaceae bacterium]|nr:hypothetical protein [Spirochaetaceae bacterium]
GGSITPWLRRGDKFDLEQINNEWTDRLRAYLTKADSLAVVVHIDLWENWSVVHSETDEKSSRNWLANAFRPGNNVQYGEEILVHETNRHDPPFYRSVPERENNEKLLALQKRFVDAVLDVTLGFNNVLYCMGNETCAPMSWARYWAAHVKSQARAQNRVVLVGDMPNADRTATPVAGYLADPAFDFVDVSQVTSHHTGDESSIANIATNTAALIHSWYRDQNYWGAKLITNSKIYCRDRVALWSKVMSGSASSRYHRPLAELKHHLIRHLSDEEANREVHSLTTFFSAVPLEQVIPEAAGRVDGDMSRGVVVQGFFHTQILASTDRSFAIVYVFDPQGTKNSGGTIDYWIKPGRVRVRFFNVQEAVFADERSCQRLPDGQKVRVRVPTFDRDLAFLLLADDTKPAMPQ